MVLLEQETPDNRSGPCIWRTVLATLASRRLPLAWRHWTGRLLLFRSASVLTDLISSPGCWNGIIGASSLEIGLGYDDATFGAISKHLGVSGQESLFSDALSPEYGSSDSPSPFTGDDDFEMEMMKMGGGGGWQQDPISRRADPEMVTALTLDRWLSTH